LNNPKAIHPYSYVANGPLNRVDLEGLSFWSVVGALVGVAAAIGLVSLALSGGTPLAIFLGVYLFTLSYVIASEEQGPRLGEFFRGFMIGLNAGLTAAIISPFNPIIGVYLGVAIFLSSIDRVVRNDIYQGVLGWSSWLMPLNWVVVVLGLIIFLFNIAWFLFTAGTHDPGKINSISMDWKTGTIIMEGGLIRSTGPSTGFNMGKFIFVEIGHQGIIPHELGHTLNLAAFGPVFHYVGAIDENAPGNNGEEWAFAEQLAESYQQRPARPINPMWD